MSFLAGGRPHDFVRRRQLLLSVSLLAGSFAGYGRAAYAQQVCVSAGGTSYLCGGTSYDTQSITRDNASVVAGDSLYVETDPPYGGNGGHAIAVSGNGDIRFVSAPGSDVFASGEFDGPGTTSGLNIVSTGDIGLTLGSVFVDTSGSFYGEYGIDAVNHGNGATTVNFDGTAIGNKVGISARSVASAGGLFVTTGENSDVEGDLAGLFASNTGTGPTVIQVDGYVRSEDGQAIAVQNFPSGADMSITTGAHSDVEGLTGIFAEHRGSGTATLDIGGTVVGTGQFGVLVQGRGSAGDLVVTTDADSSVSGATAISVSNRGVGDSLVVVGGDVQTSAYLGEGVVVVNQGYAGDATIITTEDSNIAGGMRGIFLSNSAIGGSTASIDGDVSSLYQDGLYVHNSGSATGLVVTAGSSARIEGGRFGYGINAFNDAMGDTEVTLDGDVVGTGDYGGGIRARNGAGATNLTITTGAASSVSAAQLGIWAANEGKGATTVTVNGDVTSSATAGILAQNGVTATDLSIATGAGSIVSGTWGLGVYNEGTGSTSVTVGGDVVGTLNDGIIIESAQPSTVSILAGASVEGRGATVEDHGIQITGQSSVTVAGSVTGGGGHAIRFDTTTGYDDRLELQGGWEINGSVDAGRGLDTLVFGHTTTDGQDIDAILGSNGLVIKRSGAPDASFFGFDTIDVGTFGSFLVGDGAGFSSDMAGNVGVLTVLGSVDFEAGGRFLVDVAADDGADKIIADAATLAGTVVVNAIPSSGLFVDGQRFTILETTNGIQSGFEGVDSTSVFLGFSLVESSHAVEIEADILSFDTAAGTANQAAVARSLFALGQSSDPDDQSVYSDILLAQTVEVAQAAFDAASGEIHVGVPTALAFAGAGFGQLLLANAGSSPAAASSAEPLAYAPARPAVDAIDTALGPAPDDGTYGLWGQLIAGSASIAGDGTAADLDLGFGGLAAGGEIWTGDAFSVGLAFGYTRTGASTGASDAEIDSGHIGLYGTMESGPLVLSGAAHFGLHDVETSREVLLGAVDGTAIANYGAQSFGLSADARYRLEVGEVTVTPFAAIDASYVQSDGATETGAGPLNLTIEPGDQVAGLVVAGLTLGRDWQLDGGDLLHAEVSAAYERGFGSASDRNTALAASVPGYILEAHDLDENRLAFEAGLGLDLAGGLTVSGHYRGSFGSDSTNQGGRLSIGARF